MSNRGMEPNTLRTGCLKNRICYSGYTMDSANLRGRTSIMRASRLTLLVVFSLVGVCAVAQQAPAPPPPTTVSPSESEGSKPVPGAASAPITRPSNAEFTAAADEVLKQMSDITGLALRTPVKKTLRSREEIRAYVIREMDRSEERRVGKEC